VITIPTTELIGGIQDMLPVILDEKSNLAGLVVEWDGDALHFTAYDVYSGATVAWVPGEGAEGEFDEDKGREDDDIRWGGDDAPWRTWIWLPQAKEIVKLFKLPAKLWRTPVQIKCTPGGDLIIERTDSPRGNRELRVEGDPDKARKDVPDVRVMARTMGTGEFDPVAPIGFFHGRLGAFGAARAHGTLAMAFGGEGEPIGITMGSRYAGFIYPSGAQGVHPYSFLRDGSGMVTA
jgi:hypothetical protein